MSGNIYVQALAAQRQEEKIAILCNYLDNKANQNEPFYQKLSVIFGRILHQSPKSTAESVIERVAIA